MNNFQLLPDRASNFAPQVDYLFYYLIAITVFFTLLIAVLVLFFALKYRRRSDAEIPPLTAPIVSLEIAWSIIPLALMMVMFFWGTRLYMRMKTIPKNAMQINVMGKQWMWKVQHPEGPREINELHVPVGRPVKLVMSSQDVIHDFGLPAFRVKQDVVPGMYTYQWFEATQPGEYHIFCQEYCGTEHAHMIGRVVVMEEAKYQAWLAGSIPDEPPASAGSKLFASYGCSACHGQRAPTLAGLYMSQVKLDNGQTAIADDDYLRESIIDPAAKIVVGYPPAMPSYRGQLSEEQLMQLIEYIKSLGAARVGPGGNQDEGATPGAGQGATTRPVAGSAASPSTRPVNGQPPELTPNQPPVREPYRFDDPRRAPSELGVSSDSHR